MKLIVKCFFLADVLFFLCVCGGGDPRLKSSCVWVSAVFTAMELCIFFMKARSLLNSQRQSSSRHSYTNVPVTKQNSNLPMDTVEQTAKLNPI
jgi:hypothetical protein